MTCDDATHVTSPLSSRFLGKWRLKMALEEFIQSYRKKLGSYDIKPWERAMEASVRQKQTLTELPKRPTKLKSELIDVDLVRGSTFPKEKSQFAWTFFTRDSISRVLFLPIHDEWWIEQSTDLIYLILVVLYLLQVFCLATWVWSFATSATVEWISANETLTPLVLMFIVSEILTQAERHDNVDGAGHAFDSVADDGSVDFDPEDLASLSDRGSCRSSSPEDLRMERGLRFSFSGRASSKARRKANRRASRSNGYGTDEVFHWQARSVDDVLGEYLAETESTGFRPKRQALESNETSDSGLFGVSDAARQPTTSGTATLRQRLTVPCTRLTRIDDDQSHPAREDDDLESDVSDMELGGWKAAAPSNDHDDSTSDKEATDDETLLQPTPSVAPPDHCATPTSSSDDGANPPDSPKITPEREHSLPTSEQPIGCTLWERTTLFGTPYCHKADLTVYEITNCIVKRVDQQSAIGSSRLALAVLPVLFALLPVCHGIFRTFYPALGGTINAKRASLTDLIRLEGKWSDWSVVVFKANGIVQRYFWGFWFFLLLAVAFETYQQRYLVAKYFGYLTSSRRAKRTNLPHFRLNKVRNVKSWLCIRSCLKKYGPRKSVDVIVSFSCISCLVCVIFTCFMVVNAEDQFTSSIYVWEAMLWLFAVGLFLLRFMVLGSKTNQKFRNSSILTTEQLNLYLRMEQKPHKKEQLMLVNNVLKLAADLIKEIEHPCRISGFPANPFLYNVTRLLILSAFSTLISEMCGFKIKLFKLKI